MRESPQIISRLALLIAIVALFGCKDPVAVVDEDPDLVPQHHIPWPSLADSPWPMYRHDPQGTARSQYVGPDPSKVEWELLPISGPTNGFTGFAIGPDSTIYFGSSLEIIDGGPEQWLLYAVDPRGTVKWTYYDVSHGGPAIDRAPLVRADSSIIFAILSRVGGKVYALDPTGNVLWSYWLDGQPSDLNIGLDGTLYVIGGSDLYAISPSGSLVWRLEADDFFSAVAYVGPAISPSGSTIYVIGGTGYQSLYAIDLSGNVIWSFFSGDSTTKITSMPIVDNQGNIYITPSRHHRIEAIPEAIGLFKLSSEGDVIWRYNGNHSGINDRYTLGPEGRIYTSYNGITAFGANGRQLWQIEGYFGRSTYISDAAGKIYVGSHILNTVDGTTGEFLPELLLQGESMRGPILTWDKTLLIEFAGVAGAIGDSYVWSIK